MQTILVLLQDIDAEYLWVLFFLGIIKVGVAHSNDMTLVKSPMDSNQLTSSFPTCWYASGIEKGLV